MKNPLDLFLNRYKTIVETRPAPLVEVEEEQPIIKSLKIEKPIDASNSSPYFHLSKTVGFETVAKIGLGFPQIKEYQIHRFLRETYKKRFGESLKTDEWWHNSDKTRHRCFRLYVIEEGRQVSWDEQPIADYPNLPPQHILESAKRATDAGLTDLRIVTISDSNDPLLIARHGVALFLVDWWDKDFTIDDVLNLTK